MVEESSCLHFLHFLLFHAPSFNPVSLHKTRFEETDDSIIYERGAHNFVGGIDLFSHTYQCQVGHATYVEKVQIWDSKTQKVTDFTTRFSLIVDIQRRTIYGSGFAFFLAPVDFHVPKNSAGGFLVLYNITTINSSPDQIVHIEFDSTPDPEWDPPFQHVAINISSLSSATYTPWNTTLHTGDAAIVWITYNSATKNLTVSLNYQTTGNSQEVTSLSYLIDLREVLPEWVSIGFSASTRDYIEKHTILSWVFTSSLETDETNYKIGISRKVLILATMLPFSFVIFGLILAFGVWWTRKLLTGIAEIKNLESITDLEKGSGSKRIVYTDLVSATKNFSSESILGKTTEFGATYKGYFPHLNVAVAIKLNSLQNRRKKRSSPK